MSRALRLEDVAEVARSDAHQVERVRSAALRLVAGVSLVDPVGDALAKAVALDALNDLVTGRHALPLHGVKQRHEIALDQLRLQRHRQRRRERVARAAANERLAAIKPGADCQRGLRVEVGHAVRVHLALRLRPQGLDTFVLPAGLDAHAHEVRDPLLDARLAGPVVAAAVARTVADALQAVDGAIRAVRARVPVRDAPTLPGRVIPSLTGVLAGEARLGFAHSHPWYPRPA